MKVEKEEMEVAQHRGAEVWIWVERPIESSKLTVVDELIDATELKTEDAELITRKANQDYAQYAWCPTPCRKRGIFVVRGERRDNRAY